MYTVSSTEDATLQKIREQLLGSHSKNATRQKEGHINHNLVGAYS